MRYFFVYQLIIYFLVNLIHTSNLINC